MSQNILEVQRLEALLAEKAEETRAIKDQLNRARYSTSAAPLDLDHGRSRSNTVPRSAAGMGVGVPVDMGLKTELGHSQMVSASARCLPANTS